MYTAVEHTDKKVVGLSGIVTLFLKDFTILKFQIQGQEDALNVAGSIEALSSLGKIRNKILFILFSSTMKVSKIKLQFLSKEFIYNV